VIFRILLSLAFVVLLEVLSATTYFSWAKGLRAPWRTVATSSYIVLTVLFFGFFFSFRYLRSWNEIRELRSLVSILVMAVFIAKLLISLVSVVDWTKRLIAGIVSLFFANSTVPAAVGKAMSRSNFITQLALLAGGTGAALLLSGAANRYRYKVRSIKVKLPKWHASLKGLRIVQISDIHSGSFTNVQAVAKGVQQILDLKPDLIVFTGDLVNDRASEMEDYVDVFAKLKAPLGVYSTLGNHDYGDYVQWPSAKEKYNNLEALKATHAKMGWELLLNTNKEIAYRDSSFALIGVENISGSNKFHSYGDFSKAIAGVEAHPHKILLSHDPSHWSAEVVPHEAHVDLTLSGHTHGMQFGIEIPGFKWSPVQYIYKQWAGLYQKQDKQLYVNRGFGFLGYPGRVGILPEITLLEIA
jgi:predicted MPP superfamily phosphohydrolase